ARTLRHREYGRLGHHPALGEGNDATTMERISLCIPEYCAEYSTAAPAAEQIVEDRVQRNIQQTISHPAQCVQQRFGRVGAILDIVDEARQRPLCDLTKLVRPVSDLVLLLGEL